MILKRGNTYWYKFYWSVDNGNGTKVSCLVRRSAKTKNKREAQEMQDEHRRALRLGEIHPKDAWPKPPVPNAPTFAEFTKRFLEHKKSEIKPSSLRFYEVSIAKLTEFRELASTVISKINGEVIARYVQHRRTVKPAPATATVNGELRTLRRVLHVAYDWEVISRIPAVHELPSPTPRDRVISFAEEAKYLAAATPTLERITRIAVDTGLRPPSELFCLERDAVDLEASPGLPFGLIRVKRGKTDSAARLVPLTERARQALLEQQRCAPHRRWVFPGPGNTGHLVTVQQAHRKAIAKAGLTPFVFYSWRHTFGTRAAESGMDRFALAKVMGHSSPRVTEKYYIHVRESHVWAGFEKFIAYQAKGVAAAAPSS